MTLALIICGDVPTRPPSTISNSIARPPLLPPEPLPAGRTSAVTLIHPRASAALGRTYPTILAICSSSRVQAWRACHLTL